MPDRPGHHHRHRFPAEIIAHAVWLYHRFALSLRDVEELLYERGIVVTYEAIRTWVVKFGARYAVELRRREARPGRTWHLDEVFTRVGGRQMYLWRAVDEHGQVLDVLVQEHRDTMAAERFFRRLLGHAGGPPAAIVTDGLTSYGAAKARLPQLVAVEHLHVRAAARLNNRVEQSHQPTRLREYVMRRFKSVPSAQRFPPRSAASATTSACAGTGSRRPSTVPLGATDMQRGGSSRAPCTLERRPVRNGLGPRQLSPPSTRVYLTMPCSGRAAIG